MSWRDLSEFCDLLKQEGPHAEFARGGFECVQKIIDDAVQVKYPLVGGREIAHDVAQGAFRALGREFPGIGFRFWAGRDYFNIYSIGTDITVYADLAFRVSKEAPYLTLEILDRQHITATLRTQCRTHDGKIGTRN